jgi:hypothetical protein
MQMKLKVGDTVKILDVKNGRLRVNGDMSKNIGHNCIILRNFVNYFEIQGVNGRSYYYYPEYLQKVSNYNELIKYLL